MVNRSKFTSTPLYRRLVSTMFAFHEFCTLRVTFIYNVNFFFESSFFFFVFVLRRSPQTNTARSMPNMWYRHALHFCTSNSHNVYIYIYIFFLYTFQCTIFLYAYVKRIAVDELILLTLD